MSRLKMVRVSRQAWLILTLICMMMAGAALAQRAELDVHTLRIKVKDGITGEAVEGLTINIESEGGEVVWASVTGPDGLVEASLGPGEYSVKARLNLFGLLFTIGSFSIEVTESTVAEINVSGVFLPVKYVPIAVYIVVGVLVVALIYLVSRRVLAARPSPVGNMHIDSIRMSKESKGSGLETLVWVNVAVTVKDADGIPVEGTTVSGHWEGATTGSLSMLTDFSGKMSLVSDPVNNPPPGTKFVFVVDEIVHVGWNYDPSANLETRSELTV